MVERENWTGDHLIANFAVAADDIRDRIRKPIYSNPFSPFPFFSSPHARTHTGSDGGAVSSWIKQYFAVWTETFQSVRFPTRFPCYRSPGSWIAGLACNIEGETEIESAERDRRGNRAGKGREREGRKKSLSSVQNIVCIYSKAERKTISISKKKKRPMLYRINWERKQRNASRRREERIWVSRAFKRVRFISNE